MPLACKRTKTVRADDGTEQEEEFAFTQFTYKAHWFVLAQTEGADYGPAALPEWNEATALAALNVQRIDFRMLDGNAQGYAQPGRKLAVSPVAALPHKTLFHELGHVILGHCEEKDFSESEITPRDVREVEAEAVALLCCESLGLPAQSTAGATSRNGAKAKRSRNGPPSASSAPQIRRSDPASRPQGRHSLRVFCL